MRKFQGPCWKDMISEIFFSCFVLVIFRKKVYLNPLFVDETVAGAPIGNHFPKPSLNHQVF